MVPLPSHWVDTHKVEQLDRSSTDPLLKSRDRSLKQFQFCAQCTTYVQRKVASEESLAVSMTSLDVKRSPGTRMVLRSLREINTNCLSTNPVACALCTSRIS